MANLNFNLLNGRNFKLLDGRDFDLLALTSYEPPCGKGGKKKRRPYENDDDEVMELISMICTSRILEQ